MCVVCMVIDTGDVVGVPPVITVTGGAVGVVVNGSLIDETEWMIASVACNSIIFVGTSGTDVVVITVAGTIREDGMSFAKEQARPRETSRRQGTTKLTPKALLTAAATDSAGCHRDSILSLASVKLNQRLLISSSRDGAIKVWR
ncbi:hypothetical protein GIB67_010204 [Kingdonia uniflora]|uniref:Uncharacterized protein n=1 Tax=Kingdonia uniflora TaxID=39325 RepID=A0A7J7NB08_9MAGN|nr:hypothetical protein GIB67_010204 [Kingdonia uniflora]